MGDEGRGRGDCDDLCDFLTLRKSEGEAIEGKGCSSSLSASDSVKEKVERISRLSDSASLSSPCGFEETRTKSLMQNESTRERRNFRLSW